MKVQSKTPTGKISPKNPSKSRESPGLLNRIAHHMPQGTFIPISTMFRSIADSRRSSSEVSQNLMTTFDKLLKTLPDGHQASELHLQPSGSSHLESTARPSPITIAPTESGNSEFKEVQTAEIEIDSRQVQTEIGQCKEVQTEEIEVESIHAQTEIGQCKETKELERMTSESQTYYLVESSHAQTEHFSDEKGSQSEPTNCDTKFIQTDKKVEEKENQTEITNEDKEIQTEVKFENRANETDINSSNIITVNCIEVVQEMLSWGTQTNVDELEAMDPIVPNVMVAADNNDANKMKDIWSETDSVYSSASKLAEAEMQTSKT